MWVKSRLLKLDLRSFDPSVPHVWVYRSHMRSCCTLSVSFRVASHTATTLEKYLLCVLKTDFLQIKPDVYLLSFQLIMKRIHGGLSWAIVVWKLMVSEATRHFWVSPHSKNCQLSPSAHGFELLLITSVRLKAWLFTAPWQHQKGAGHLRGSRRSSLFEHFLWGSWKG